jgi:hypothetical protein
VAGVIGHRRPARMLAMASCVGMDK